MDLAIVVVTHNHHDLLRQCLRSALAAMDGIDGEVVVVDNASMDATPQVMADEFQQVRVIRNETNVHYTRAVNQGMRATGGRFVFLLNDDPTGDRRADSTRRMIRVLHTLPDPAMGGGQQVVARNIAHLDSSKFESHVAYFRTCGNRDIETLLRASGVEPRLFRDRGWRSARTVTSELCTYLRDCKIDVVHVQGTSVETVYAQGAARKCGLPVVRTLHGVRAHSGWSELLARPHPVAIWRSAKQKALDAYCMWLDRRTIRYVIAGSDDARRSWSRYLVNCGISADRVCVCYNGVPLECYPFPLDDSRSTALRAELCIDDAYPVLINIGNLSKRKGQDLLVSMMESLIRRCPDARLLLVGEGEERNRLEALIGEGNLSSSVLLLGQRLDVPELLAVSDVFVFATTGAFEGFPLSVLEAMAAGRPVVSVPYPNATVVLRDGWNGRLVSKRSATALAEAVQDVTSDRRRAALLGQRGRAVVEESFSLLKTVERLQSVYTAVAGPHAGSC